MKKLICLFAIFCAALANTSYAKNYKNIILVQGSFTKNDDYATQVISVSNHSGKTLTRVFVECAYYGDEKLIASGSNLVENLDNEETGSAKVISDNAKDAILAKCRIVSAE